MTGAGPVLWSLTMKSARRGAMTYQGPGTHDVRGRGPGRQTQMANRCQERALGGLCSCPGSNANCPLILRWTLSFWGQHMLQPLLFQLPWPLLDSSIGRGTGQVRTEMFLVIEWVRLMRNIDFLLFSLSQSLVGTQCLPVREKRKQCTCSQKMPRTKGRR